MRIITASVLGPSLAIGNSWTPFVGNIYAGKSMYTMYVCVETI